MTTHSNNLYQTSDTSLACYLIAEGFIPAEIDYSEPRYVFIFEGDPEKLKMYEHKYIVGKATVDPSIYSRINRKLMRTIKNQMQWGGA